MEVSLTTPAILFPAISLLLLAYTNRFLAIARIVRDLAHSIHDHEDENIRRQIVNLRLRINLIKSMQAFGVGSMLCCVLSIICFYFNLLEMGEVLFGVGLLCMLISLMISLRETLLSGAALKLELERCLNRVEDSK